MLSRHCAAAVHNVLQRRDDTVSLTPHLFALAGAVSSALATILIRRGLRHGDFYIGFWINVIVGVVGLWGAVLLLEPADAYRAAAIPLFMLSGIIGTASGRLLRFVSIEKVGAPVAASIINLNPFIATGLAIVVLGERVTLPIIGGTCVIVLGTTLLSLSGRRVGFRPSYLFYPFLSASCFGTVAIIRKLGLSQAGPLFGSAVNITTALVTFTAFLLASGNRQALVWKGRGTVYFVGAGIAENLSVFLVLVAMSLGEVSVVAPLAGTAPLFVLPFTSVFLKGVETLTGRIVVGAMLIVLGVVLLTMKAA
jgi:DME family drug/metabolite transporter